MSSELKKGQQVALNGGLFTALASGTYSISVGSAASASATIVGKLYRTDWTEAEFLEHLEKLEQYPEAAKAMKLYNSKLRQALK